MGKSETIPQLSINQNRVIPLFDLYFVVSVVPLWFILLPRFCQV